eukprot:TRINITY_DN95419_c0_g1_i1.p1 TRINITY_DN95419_c0_g1~~TRINITY_DN95419_c0_g1_i1.p1  ORF type:complete len:335 (-),score=47.38 TRINITY_DN95419_c0_g1_i1:10-1014(-)
MVSAVHAENRAVARAGKPSGMRPGVGVLYAAARPQQTEDIKVGPPGVATLLRAVTDEQPEEHSGKSSTLGVLQEAILSIQPPRKVQPVAFRRRPKEQQPAAGAPRSTVMPILESSPARARLAGVTQLQVGAFSPTRLPGLANPREEALLSLSALVSAFRSQADFGEQLASYYRGTAPAHGLILSDWLAAKTQNAFVWSRMHHKVRQRSQRRHYSMQAFAEALTPRQHQVRRYLTYVKGWMSELDDQDTEHYQSKWLCSKANRGNLARFFRLPPNCALMAGYVEEVVAVPRHIGLAADAEKAFARIDRALLELGNDNTAVHLDTFRMQPSFQDVA